LKVKSSKDETNNTNIEEQRKYYKTNRQVFIFTFLKIDPATLEMGQRASGINRAVLEQQ